MNENKDKLTTVTINRETLEKLSYMCKVLNVKKGVFLKELLNQVFSILGTYDSANITYAPDVTHNYLFMQFLGKNRMISGSFKFPEENNPFSPEGEDSFCESKMNEQIKEKLEKKV